MAFFDACHDNGSTGSNGNRFYRGEDRRLNLRERCGYVSQGLIRDGLALYPAVRLNAKQNSAATGI